MRKGCVLFVDDEVNLLFIVGKFFKDKNWKVYTAFNAKEGLKLAEEKKPDIVILDIRMPGMDGLEALKKLKSLKPSLPVIMLTAYGTQEYIQECLELGASEFLSKPFDLKALEKTIEKILAKQNKK